MAQSCSFHFVHFCKVLSKLFVICFSFSRFSCFDVSVFRILFDERQYEVGDLFSLDIHEALLKHFYYISSLLDSFFRRPFFYFCSLLFFVRFQYVFLSFSISVLYVQYKKQCLFSFWHDMKTNKFPQSRDFFSFMIFYSFMHAFSKLAFMFVIWVYL